MEKIEVGLDFIMGKTAYKEIYDGESDDLLTAGLGKFDMKSDKFGKPGEVWDRAPVFNDPENPTFAELRRRAIYNNYRALMDMSTAHPTAHYGELYGPGVKAGGGEGFVAGEEYIALAHNRVTMMVQIPSHFDVKNPCIVTAPSSGSRGIYGAIATVGEWGLKRGFVVVYTDKGTGMGVHNLKTDTVNLVTGEREKATLANNRSNFTAISDDAEERKKILEGFNKKYPDRLAFKHAHSATNPEKEWGKHVLDSIKFAFYILNKKFSRSQSRFNRSNTLVIASGVSNGGAASIRAAEQDTEGFIDGVAVAEPNVCPVYNETFSIVQGEGKPFTGHSKDILDYMTLLHIYQPCACLDPALEKAPFNLGPMPYGVPGELAENRCRSLAEKGLLKSETTIEQAREAQKIINDYGLLPEQNILQPSHHTFDVIRSCAVTYANQYGRFDVLDNLCGYSLGATDEKSGAPIPLCREKEAKLFSDHCGIPPYAGVDLINNESEGGPREDRLSVSPSTKRQDLNLDGALRLRSLVTGIDEPGGDNKPLTGDDLEKYKRVQNGIAEVRASGDLRGLPVVMVTGRSDAVLPPNHTSRAYFGLNKLVEGSRSNLHYYEVTNAHHLDTLNMIYSKFQLFYAPLHYFFIQALDLMYDHLKNGALLPKSQVVRTNPPKRKLPSISKNPRAEDLITFENNIVKIPE